MTIPFWPQVDVSTGCQINPITLNLLHSPLANALVTEDNKKIKNIQCPYSWSCANAPHTTFQNMYFVSKHMHVSSTSLEKLMYCRFLNRIELNNAGQVCYNQTSALYFIFKSNPPTWSQETRVRMKHTFNCTRGLVVLHIIMCWGAQLRNASYFN